VGNSAEKASVLWDTVHLIRFCCGVGYNGIKTPALWDTTEKTTSLISHYRRINSCNVGYNGKKIGEPSRGCCPLYPTMEKDFFRCIPQQKKTLTVVSHKARNAAVLYPTTAEKTLNFIIFTKINFSEKLF
jgi:hypothetical protein